MFGLHYCGRVEGALSFVVVDPSWRRFWCADSAASTYLGRFVVYRSHTEMSKPRVRRHEVVHVQQSRDLGVIQFLMLYRYYHARHGYRDNPLEKEARRAARMVNVELVDQLRKRGISVRSITR